ncbi:MAG: hypothetical protein ACKN9A_06770, partial [Microcystis aeruginosa]
SQKHSSKDVRETMQTRLYNLLDKYNLSALKQPITWGADELVAMGIAQTLPALPNLSCKTINNLCL